MSPADYELEGDDAGPEYRPVEDIQQFELAQGLCSLLLLGDDLFLRMQATNLGMVDEFIMDIEAGVARDLFANDRTPSEAFFLSAQTQMWLFAAYEIMRTWRERARDIEKRIANNTLQARIDELERERGYVHHSALAQAKQMREFLKDQSLIERLREDQRVMYSTFTSLEYIRMTLAKHQAPKSPRIAAYAPGYGRINRWCGSLDYELERDGMVFGMINRRQIADGIRAFADRSKVPSEKDIEEQEKIWLAMRTVQRPDYK